MVDGITDGRTDNPKAVCPCNVFEVGGIKRGKIMKNDSFTLSASVSVATANVPKEV